MYEVSLFFAYYRENVNFAKVVVNIKSFYKHYIISFILLNL